MDNSIENKIIFDSGRNSIFLNSFLTFGIFFVIPIVVLGVLKISNFSTTLVFSLLSGIIGVIFYVKLIYVKFTIYEDRIVIFNPYSKMKDRVIDSNEIELFSMIGNGGEVVLIVKSKDGYKKSLGHPQDIFQGTKILKIYKDRGIKVEISPKNHELELYLGQVYFYGERFIMQTNFSI